ncbi:serine hydrolase domain-containing protein [Hymenobacter sp. B81]|uniref:serine hydrolase domain-containing protein n=1 Tax=Hymenobacter sp. B81 TaxID=3344878 RepID=UPI0037DD0A4F
MKTTFHSACSLVAGALLLLAGACGRPQAQSAGPAAATPTPVQAINVALGQLNQRGEFSGAALVADKGRVVYQQAFGFAREAAAGQELRADARFDVTALAPTFTAAAVLALRDQGELRLDDALSAYVPNLPYPGVTLRHLLTHTSGLPEVDVRESGNDVAAELYYQRPAAAFAPGSRWAYAAVNDALLRKVVERVSGLAFADYLSQAVFGPLNMRDTRVLAAGRDAEGNLAESRIYSTLNDLHAWVQGLRSGQLLAPASVQELFTPARLQDGSFAQAGQPGRPATFGMGWFLGTGPGRRAGHTVAWHAASQQGYFAYLGFDLSADRIVILLDNTPETRGALATAAVMQQALSGQRAVAPAKRSAAREMGRLLASQGLEAAVLHYASVHTDTSRYYASQAEFEQLSRALQARQRPADAEAVLAVYAATSGQSLAARRQLRAQLAGQRRAVAAPPAVLAI